MYNKQNPPSFPPSRTNPPKFNCNRINLYNKENGGVSSARNLGIQKANGKYISFLDADDVWLPNKIEYQIKILKEKKNKVYSQFIFNFR